MAAMRACACVERTMTAHACPGRLTSPRKRPCPRSRRASSTRLMPCPIPKRPISTSSWKAHSPPAPASRSRNARDITAGTMAPPSRNDIIEQDVRDLARLGYAQQLYREMGGFSNFAISFSIISVLTGAVLLFGYGLKVRGTAGELRWLAAGESDDACGRGVDGGDRVRVSDRRRSLF